VASAGGDGTIRVWDTVTGGSIVLSGHEGPVRALAVTGDGGLVSGGADGTVRMWDPGRGTGPVATWRGHDRDVLAVAVDPAQPLVATGGVDGTVRVWDAGGQGRVIATLGNEARALTWSPDGQTLAVAGADGRIRRYAAPDFTATGNELVHGAEIRDLAYSADGSVLASAGRDLIVRLWQSDGTLLATLSPQSSDLRAVAFLPGDRSVVSASNDGRVKIWPAPAAWRETACALAGRDLGPEEWDRYAGEVGGAPPVLCS
jgi:WD40 repeat protein